ncbi:MAG: hypothetical protein KGV57_03385 [Fusobacterium sp.]|nr:hypothetical protein [Fusobacterium sp.]
MRRNYDELIELHKKRAKQAEKRKNEAIKKEKMKRRANLNKLITYLNSKEESLDISLEENHELLVGFLFSASNLSEDIKKNFLKKGKEILEEYKKIVEEKKKKKTRNKKVEGKDEPQEE